jgi:hypothetical protein
LQPILVLIFGILLHNYTTLKINETIENTLIKCVFISFKKYVYNSIIKSYKSNEIWSNLFIWRKQFVSLPIMTKYSNECPEVVKENYSDK